MQAVWILQVFAHETAALKWQPYVSLVIMGEKQGGRPLMAFELPEAAGTVKGAVPRDITKGRKRNGLKSVIRSMCADSIDKPAAETVSSM